MRLWNIGAEGQLLMGAWGAGGRASWCRSLPRRHPAPFFIVPLMIVAGFACGALWGLIPGVLKARFGVNEIIVDADAQLHRRAVDHVLGLRAVERGRLPAVRSSSRASAWLPRLTDFAKQVPGFSGLTVHLGFVVRHCGGGDRVVHPEAQPMGLRDPAHR